MSEKTDFGFDRVSPEEKTRRVRGVFESVATNYDLMNDLMSGGLHRAWKRFAVEASGIRAGASVLDVAGGTADLARLFAERAGETGRVVLTDINGAMLSVGRDRMLNEGKLLPAVQCDAEALPFAARSFDCVSIAFGLRNVTRKDAALAEMRRVLKPGGVALILEFSRIWEPLRPAYDWYSFNVLPRLGRLVAGSELPLSGRVDTHASGPGGAQSHDGDGRPGACRMVQPGSRRRRAASRLRVVNAAGD